jgi:hypothetical protein
MKCKACDCLLTDFETTRKFVKEDGKVEYPDLCNDCLDESDLDELVVIVEREDLAHNDDFDAASVNDFIGE